MTIFHGSHFKPKQLMELKTKQSLEFNDHIPWSGFQAKIVTVIQNKTIIKIQ
jgi:hypothetical protein